MQIDLFDFLKIRLFCFGAELILTFLALFQCLGGIAEDGFSFVVDMAVLNRIGVYIPIYEALDMDTVHFSPPNRRRDETQQLMERWGEIVSFGNMAGCSNQNLAGRLRLQQRQVAQSEAVREGQNNSNCPVMPVLLLSVLEVCCCFLWFLFAFGTKFEASGQKMPNSLSV